MKKAKQPNGFNRWAVFINSIRKKEECRNDSVIIFCMQALLVYNPAAGRIPVGPFVYRAAEILRRAGWQVRIMPTRSGDHAVELAKQAAGQVDAVFAIGGDGTVGQVAAGLAGSSTALGVLPAGTQNVMAGELGLRSFGWSRWWALDENIRQLIDAPVYSVDVGLCNGKTFLLWAGLGLDALTVHKVEPRLRFEKYLAMPQYAALTIWNATFWHGMDLNIHADGRLVDGHYLLALVTNIRTYLGGLAQISPQACLDDGQMDLWLFSGDNLGDAVRHAFGMMAGLHLTAGDALRVPFRTLRLESASPFFLQMDGEPHGQAQSAEFSVLPRALKLLVPRRSLSLLAHAQATNLRPTGIVGQK
jgi:YegS/Rv2252/BmrU family lipid kinase